MYEFRFPITQLSQAAVFRKTASSVSEEYLNLTESRLLYAERWTVIMLDIFVDLAPGVPWIDVALQIWKSIFQS